MRARTLLILAAALVVGVTALACDGGEDGDATASATAAATESPSGSPEASPTATQTASATPTPTAAPGGPPSTDPRPVVLEAIEPDVVLERPVDVFVLADDPAYHVVDQGGLIYRIADGEATPVLNLSDRVSTRGNEEGLLSAQPDPDASTDHLWVYYSAADPRRTVLSRFTRDEQGVFDPLSELVILDIPQPYANHNGGAIRFGPDGMLYLGLGDGGSGGDPQGNGQDPGTLLGSILRLDVRSASAQEHYRVPTDNPLVGGTGVRAEVWAYGLRNPWRMEFDAATGLLWVGDVGQNAVEEISIVTSGANLGWNVMEGDTCYNATSCNQTGLTAPVTVYGHAGGHCSVTGGPVVRNGETPEVEGSYLYADFCSGNIWALRADLQGEPLRVLDDAGSVAAIRQVGRYILVLSFGEPLRRIVSP
ncbi:MAG: PQQ-dependent sugar dehydrogenase [Dehalococcoidia bacterium]|nr:PQQ-dependent sugar dehydrogenase [Dehalococcoidia bacterium]